MSISSERIAHRFIYGGEDESYDYASYNTGFNRNRYYSYNSVLATIDRDKHILIINKSIATYSSISSKHHWDLRSATPSYYTIFMNPHPGLDPMEGYLKEVLNLLEKATRARTTDYITPATEFINEALLWSNTFKVDKRSKAYKELIRLHSNVDDLITTSAEILAKGRESKRKAKLKFDKLQQKSKQEDLNRFLGTDTVTYDPDYNSVYLKIVDNQIKTSNHITVDLAPAKLLWKCYLSGKQILGLGLGQYKVVQANSVSVTLGCTKVSKKELSRVLG